MKRLETMKYEKYKTMYARAGVDFVPLTVEMHGDLRYFFEVSEEVGIGCC
jgi:hypothetical protein